MWRIIESGNLCVVLSPEETAGGVASSGTSNLPLANLTAFISSPIFLLALVAYPRHDWRPGHLFVCPALGMLGSAGCYPAKALEQSYRSRFVPDRVEGILQGEALCSSILVLHGPRPQR